jgi:hypothetical protein
MNDELATAPHTVKRETRPRKPRPQPQRFIRLLAGLYGGSGPGVVRIRVGTEPAVDYLVTELPHDFGASARAFCLQKCGVNAGNGNETYHILIDGSRSSCECPGFLRHGLGKSGTGCKHIAGLTALITRKLL